MWKKLILLLVVFYNWICQKFFGVKYCTTQEVNLDDPSNIVYVSNEDAMSLETENNNLIIK
jgi:hypothetical protein